MLYYHNNLPPCVKSVADTSVYLRCVVNELPAALGFRIVSIFGSTYSLLLVLHNNDIGFFLSGCAFRILIVLRDRRQKLRILDPFLDSLASYEHPLHGGLDQDTCLSSAATQKYNLNIVSYHQKLFISYR